MFTAREANQKTKEVIDNYRRDLKNIEDKIEVAVSRGEFCIVIDNYLNDLVVKKLFEFGYKVNLNNEEMIKEEILICDKICPLKLNRNSSPYYTIEWS